MKQDFGKTWWGEAWLDALSHIDYANRIPRGASYARRGYVRGININPSGLVTASVRGSRPRPYTVNLLIQPLTKFQKEKLVNEIMRNPIVVSKLLNHELDPLLLTIADKNGIEVFPRSWSKFRMNCSCPDYAVPCKHIAAVMYMISREIDNDPFVLFQLLGIDLMAEMKKRGLEIDNLAVDVPPLSTVVSVAKEPQEVGAELKMPDFTSVDDMGEAIVGLLPKNPVFFPKKDFRELYSAALTRVRKVVDRLFDHRISVAEFVQSDGESLLSQSSKVRVLMSSTMEYKAEIADGTKKLKAVKTSDLMRMLLQLPAGFVSSYDDSVQALRMALLAALNALAKGMVSPQVVSLPKEKVAVRWVPCKIDSMMRTLIDHFDEEFPAGIMLFKDKGRVKPINLTGSEAISAFLTLIMSRHSAARLEEDKVYDMFFRGALPTFNEVGEAGVPANVKVWVDHLYSTTRRWHPSIVVKESLKADWFYLKVGVTDTSAEESQMVMLDEVFAGKKYADVRFDVLKDLSALSSLIPGLEAYINDKARLAIRLENEAFAEFLTQVIPAVRLVGVDAILPKSMKDLIKPRPTVSIGVSHSDGKKYIRLDQLLNFKWEIALGDQVLTEEEFEQMKSNAGKLIKFKQQYVYFSERDIELLHKKMVAKDVTGGKLLQAALAEEYYASTIVLDDEAKKRIDDLRQWKEESVPESVNAELRPYQQRGFSWMCNMLRLGFGCILADDMGLGKTLQTITLLQKLKDDGEFKKKKALVVVPMGLMANWQAEISRFAPGLSAFIYHGNARSVDDFSADVMITTYGTLRSDVVALKKLKWKVLVIDEAQNIKNNSAQQTKAVKSIAADWRLALSGTPVENRLSEFWSIMDFVNKGYLGSEAAFGKEFARPIQLSGDESCAKRFRKITAPMMLRRLKTDKNVISDLPDKIELNEYASLTPAQASLYQKVVDESMAIIENVDVVDNESLFKRQGLVLQMMLALKQICNHPTQYLKNGVNDAALSGKTEMLIDLLSNIFENGEKVLVFTQFKEMGDLLVRFIAEAFGREPMFLHGGLGVKARSEIVERFQSVKTDNVLVLSLKAAGTGLNLTAASHVVHYDLWWNPAVEAQATDRAYRIGQHKNVMVHRFITKDTFEERINDMIQSKRGLADMTVSTGENWIGKLTNAELREIFE